MNNELKIGAIAPNIYKDRVWAGLTQVRISRQNRDRPYVTLRNVRR
ncbi:MAG: hypothetical protein ACLFV6_07845 [Spirulinaceae cyanobacterium]